MKKWLLALAWLAQPTVQAQTLQPALASIEAAQLLQHIKTLASDEFEGRGPGTKGEELTVGYVVQQFKKLGLQPGNPDGTYVQKVPLMGFTAQPTASLTTPNQTIDLKFPEDYVAVSRRFIPKVQVKNSDIVFVGYGVVAPEYGWDDYKGLDVKGKTLLMLINDPAVPDPKNPNQLDPQMFKGSAMTYYGRWTYKYEIAAAKGAAAAIIIHETGPAGYPYAVVSGSWSRENFDIQTPDKNMGRAAVEAWITLDKAKALLTASGLDFETLKKSAQQPTFKPVSLPAQANFTLENTLRPIQSKNVIARLPGSDPKLNAENILYTAHWDHLGRDPKLTGDQIYNGAVDNASGVALVLETAEAFTKLKTAPKRSVLFMLTTAEEKGLLGAKYYATNPLYPLTKTLANFNVDSINTWGLTSDLECVGFGNSTLDDVLIQVAKTQGRIVKPDSEPAKGYFYRSDHFELAKQGVPALYVGSGKDFIGKPVGYGEAKAVAYTANDYHKVSDQVKPDWDLAGAVQDTQLLFTVGYEVAQGKTYPQWKPGTEFKALREKMLKP